MNGKIYFEYRMKEIDYLKSKDAALGKAIDEIKHVYREVIPKACNFPPPIAYWKRLKNLVRFWKRKQEKQDYDFIFYPSI